MTRLSGHRCWFSALAVALLLALWTRPAGAWVGKSPPWGNDAVIALVGEFNYPYGGYPRLVFKNVQSGSAYYGACSAQDLPHSGDNLTDDVTVYGGGGDDKFSVGHSGAVTCGSSTFTLQSTAIPLNGHWLDADGLGGNDYIVDRLGDAYSYVWGGDGNDDLECTNQGAYVLGGGGTDKIRSSSTLFNFHDRNLFAEGGNSDCVESNNGSSATYMVWMDGGAGTSDAYSTLGTQSAQDHQAFETNIGNTHCMGIHSGLCSTGSDCYSGTCSSGSCVLPF